jgi:hypothetical protein
MAFRSVSKDQDFQTLVSIKITNSELVEWLPNECEVLSSNSSAAKKKKDQKLIQIIHSNTITQKAAG